MTRGPSRCEQFTAALAERRPRALIVLGSGLGALAEAVVDPLVVGFAEAGLPAPTVAGHPGRLLAGTLDGVEVLVQQGRVHLYEGHSAAAVAACVRLAAAAGVGTLIVTNAAGGLRAGLCPGDLLLITDQLNLTGTSPLIGQNAFVDMSAAYDPGLRPVARRAAEGLGEPLVEGVYAGLAGPAYETPAEARMLRLLGADAVGMSTVIEVIAARALGMRVLGCSLIANVHAAQGEGVHHGEVLAVSAAAGPRLARILHGVVAAIAADPLPNR